MENLEVGYDATEGLFRRKRLPIHRPRYKNILQQFVKNEKSPYKVDLFYRCFQFTYYVIFQVLGYSRNPMIPKELMLLACDVQSETDYKCYDYPQFVADALHESLVKIQQCGSKLTFKWYSLLMHMILFQGHKYGVWSHFLIVKTIHKGVKMLVQLWTAIWDSGYQHSQALVLEKYFFKRIYVACAVEVP